MMTNLEFRECLKRGEVNVIYIDFNCPNRTEYIHTILKAGKKQVNLYDNFLKCEYQLSFRFRDFTNQYKIK